MSNFDKAKCSRCGVLKPIEELNGVDLFASVFEQKNITCRKAFECDSDKARALINEVIERL